MKIPDIEITEHFCLPGSEIEMTAVRAQGAGGQNVNKVSSAVHLRFDINASSLPEAWKVRLLALRDSRITRHGVVVIKAQENRSQGQNRDVALQRLRELIARAARSEKLRVPTRPTHASGERRLDDKTRRSRLKALRGPVDD